MSTEKTAKSDRIDREAQRRFAQVLTDLALRGTRQKDVGKEIGVGPTYISQMKSGNAPVTARTAAVMERTYNVRFQWLMYGEGPMWAAEEGEGGEASPSEEGSTMARRGAVADAAQEVIVVLAGRCPDCRAWVEAGATRCSTCLSRLRWPPLSGADRSSRPPEENLP